jgi:hypothetical protein
MNRWKAFLIMVSAYRAKRASALWVKRMSIEADNAKAYAFFMVSTSGVCYATREAEERAEAKRASYDYARGILKRDSEAFEASIVLLKGVK